MTLFSAPRDASPRSNDDQSSTRGRPRKFFHRYAHDLSMSSQSLAATSSYHDDLPTPSVPTYTPYTASTQSTPMTSPSTGYSSLFPGSLSSATSESAPESKYQSEFGLLTPGASSAHSPIHGSASSSSSYPISPLSRSTTESDSQTSASHMPCRYPSSHFSSRPSTAPHSPPLSPAASSADNSQVEHHTRPHSRLTMSIKNLLSRSAVPSPSRLSYNSAAAAPSDGDASSRSFHVLATAGKWPMTPRKSRPADLEISGTVASAMSSPGHASNPPIDAHRRYASEAVAKIYNPRMGNGPPTSPDCLDASARNVPLPPARGRDPKTRNVLRRRPSGSAKLFKRRERGMSSTSCSHEGDADRLRLPSKEGMTRQGGPSFPLTAAGAVVEAYKQQELHYDDTSNLPNSSIEDKMSSSASHEDWYERDHLEHSSPTPYYTVLGSSSGRVMQAGSPDDRWSRFEADQHTWTTSRATALHQPSLSDSGTRSLARKVSNRWRRCKGGGVMSEESPLRDRGHSKGRPSLQELWAVDRSGTRSMGRSMDGVPNAPREGPSSSPIAGHAHLAPEKGEGSEGGKLWRLIRRISTGGLRDQFQSERVVPPVPAIPKGVLEKANQGERSSSEPLSPSHYHSSSSVHDRDHTRTTTAPKYSAVGLPSAATSSSSPISPDVTSAQSFHKTHSVRSSVSSYGEAMATSHMTETALERRIITPLEQLRLADDPVGSGELATPPAPIPRSPRRSTSVPAGLRTVEDAERARAPLPSPRRQTCSGESPSACSSRPSSTSGPASGNTRLGRGLGLGGSRMEDGTVSLSPPPRPPKHSRRGGGGSVASSPPHSMTIKHVDSVGIGLGGARQMDRVPSAQSDMTARIHSPEPGGSRDHAASPHTSTQLTFRQLNTPRRPPLSEQEKADIWNELLARSDEAGGTLHINGAAELMSDSMRFSTISET